MNNIDTIMAYVLFIICIIVTFVLYKKWDKIGNLDCPSCESKDSYLQ